MADSNRILLVLPMYGGSLPIGRYCVDALRRLGHRVEVFEAPDFYGSYGSLSGLGVGVDKLDYLQNAYLQFLGQAVLAKVDTFKPDLVLAMAQAPLSRQALKRLRRDGVTTAMWFMEDHQLFTYWKAFAPLYDIFAVIQKEPFTSLLHEAGQTNTLYLPLAADPHFHQPLELNSVERKQWGSDVSFMGAGYPNRRVAFRQLLGFNLKIWGNEWDGDTALAPYNQLGGRRVSPEECIRIFNATRININLHSSIQARELITHGDFVNPRTFELAACGAFQLVDDRQLLEESFAEDELARFGSMEELKEQISFYLKHDNERQAMAQKARARVLKEHTYERRMQQLMDFTASRIVGWPPSAQEAVDSVLAGLPSELQFEINTRLQEFGLASHADFQDVVQAVRSNQGILSSLDTSILFLDEWRKQYLK